MKKEDEKEWREWEAVEPGDWMVYSNDVYLLEWLAWQETRGFEMER